MQKLIIFIFLLIAGAQAFAQKGTIAITQARKEVGINLLTNSPIEGIEYNLPERIHDYFIDTLSNAIILQLRGLRKGKWLDNKGNVFRYDLSSNSINWSKKIAYQLESIEQYNSTIIHTATNKSYCLDENTGKQLWEVKNSIYFAGAIDNVGIGYKIQSAKGPTNILEGIDLSNGTVLWQREISREYSWNEAFYINDSTLLIAAAGLHTVNIKDGTGWDFNSITGKKNYTASAVGTGVGIAAGLLTGTYAVHTGHDLVRDVVSNIIVDSLYIYFASKENITKLDKKGNVLWFTALPRDLTSKSTIFIKDDKLFMINRGYAFMGYRQLDFGTPFIASYDLNNGNQLFLTTVSKEKKEQIDGYDIKNNTLLLIFDDHISKYSMNDGSMIMDKAFNIESSGELRYFMGNQVYLKQDSIFLSLPSIDSTKHYVFTKSGKILVLDTELGIEDEVNYEEVYIYYLRTNNLRFIAKENQTYVLDESGQKVAEFTASSGSILLDKKLYNAREASFLAIDLAELLQK